MPIPESETALLARTSLRETTYARLRDAIVDGTLARCERLRDPELERWLGVSRTPIREALLELQRAGLVIARAGRETLVAPLDVAATREAEEVASALHGLAARLATERLAADPAERAAALDRIRAANDAFAAAIDAADVDAALAADDTLHAALVAASGNALLGRQLAQVTPLLRRVERLRFGSLAGRESVAQHRVIAAAVEAGDADAAAAASAENWHTLDAIIADHDQPADQSDPAEHPATIQETP